MRCSVAKTFSTLILLSVSSAQTSPSRYVEIKLPDGLPSESIFVRYVLNADELGDWVQPHTGVTSYLIDTTRAGRPATRMRTILYSDRRRL
jgi:hypothetical protein